MPSWQQPEPDANSDASTERPSEPATDGNRWRKPVAVGLTVIVLAVVFAGILPKFGSYGDAWISVKQMSPLELVALVLAVTASIVIYVFPLQCALPGLRFWPAFMTRQTSFTISNAVPAGGAIGLGVQYSMLSGGGATGPSISAAIAIVSVFNLLVTLALPVLGVLAMLWVGTPTTAQIIGSISGLVVVVLLIGLFAVVLRSERWAQHLGGAVDSVSGVVSARLGRERRPSIAGPLVSFRESTVDVIRSRWLAISVSSVAQQLSQFVVFLVALRATQSNTDDAVSVLSAFAAFSIARLASFIPVTPGGLGTVDAGLVGVLVTLGAQRSDALAATLLWRAASWVPQVLIGVVTLVIWRFRKLHGTIS
ncbi:MAG TPA: YbhN family protein [Microthrixaceae bacterium]|nr:YbhN family protein [Microthrixaceae bacterium]